MQKIRREWFGNPHAKIILDFEYHNKLLRVMKEEAVFQVAIANALGVWVLPQTPINHCISTLELHRKAGTLWATAHKKIEKDDLLAQEQEHGRVGEMDGLDPEILWPHQLKSDPRFNIARDCSHDPRVHKNKSTYNYSSSPIDECHHLLETRQAYNCTRMVENQ
jgi:hypothetical protein